MHDDAQEESDTGSCEIEDTIAATFKSSASSSEEAEKGKDAVKDDRSSPKRITQQLLREVEKELCLIKLCWPEVDVRKDLYLNTLPKSYSTVNGKERLLAWYAENFRRQFHAMYPDRKPLLLMCENECGVQKFVSTTIRRSTLPYPELYTWQGCGKFVSDYTAYEPLDKAVGMPKQLRTPTYLLNFQKGNSFECATFLTSLLLGQGYNAFVVSGYASRKQTLSDMTRTSCSYLKQPEAPPVAAVHTDTSKYKLKPPPDFKSQFLLELENKKENLIAEEAQQQEKEWQKLVREFERHPIDKLHGRRIHSWVVILPEEKGLREQEITQPIFIEPSTGVSCKVSDPETGELYLGIESIWNDQNYWVNMQPRAEGCASMKWDLNKVEHWEHLLPGEPWWMRGAADEVDEEVVTQQEKHLDMPFSYVNEISINEIDFERRYPNGRKIMLYKKTKVELYAPYVQADGLIERITVYDDYEYRTACEIYEKFLNRSDNLTETRKNLNNDSVIDYYERGRPDQCKEHRYFESSSDAIDTERILNFYDTARTDGLSQIEMHRNYLTQRFAGRDDLLIYRHVEFNMEKSMPISNDIHYRQIWKIVEKFDRNERIRASKDVAIREFSIGENEICLVYHYNPGQCSRATRTFVKPQLAERGDRLIFDPSMTRGYNPNPLDEPDKSLDLFYELNKQLQEEDACICHARAAEVEAFAFLKTRNLEYFTPELRISTFDRHRGAESRTELVSQSERIRAQNRRDVTEEVDPLKPYLAAIGNPAKLTKSELHSLEKECLNDYKHLLVRRANNILRKFEECAQELGKMQILLTQSEDLSREEEEQILEKTNEINFTLHTLEIRLNRHKDLVPERYRMLVNQLRQNLTSRR